MVEETAAGMNKKSIDYFKEIKTIILPLFFRRSCFDKLLAFAL